MDYSRALRRGLIQTAEPATQVFRRSRARGTPDPHAVPRPGSVHEDLGQGRELALLIGVRESLVTLRVDRVVEAGVGSRVPTVPAGAVRADAETAACEGREGNERCKGSQSHALQSKATPTRASAVTSTS